MKIFINWLIYAILPLSLFIIALMMGRFFIAPEAIVKTLAAHIFGFEVDVPARVQSIIIDTRLPRIFGAMLVGAALALSGSCYQGVFRNPLVSSFTLGVSAGAGFGAALAILLFANNWMVPLSAFAFASLAVLCCFGISRLYRSYNILILILSGIIVGSVFTALLALVKYTADPFSKLPVIEYWLLGSLASIGNSDVIIIAIMMIPAAFILILLRWRLNILAMGDETARQLGINPALYRFIYIAAATLIAAAAVSVSGIIGWVGLVIPHITRIIIGPDFRKLIPASIAIGACFLLIIDSLSRSLTSIEIPLGILTALVGAPIFLILLRRNSMGWNS
ncbi:FecCD family ABC transporter permease [Bartonella sp. HY761]|uniref:FecCD family ABC transporter permease n=1 Tax=Bartonella sp. HY761 TaxID=2979330 RepID=UPI0021FFEDEC|nr:iron ABC transporter permease [Bartonella sp. HY761]UXN05670.1 iron ABC transporter permease [Bartonella sp. HY761]